MTYSGVYPSPTRTETNARFLDAWVEGKLILQKCGTCGITPSFPRDLCPSCWSTDLMWEQRSGEGKIVEFTVVHSHVSEPFSSEGPVVFAEVLLKEGGRMFSRIITENVALINAGMSVAIIKIPEAAKYSLPTFTCNYKGDPQAAIHYES
jgi:uncharacterized OB-fold protein